MAKSVGHGKIIATRNLNLLGQPIIFQNTFSLGLNDSFVKIVTQVINNSTETLKNLIIWTGTRDDFVGMTDVNTKTRGNLDTGNFTAVTANNQSSRAIMITNTNEGVLFYSETPGVMTSYALCCSFSNAYNVNPLSLAPMTPSPTDGSYAAVLPLGDIAIGSSGSITWYYAAGAVTSLTAVAQSVAAAQVADASPSLSPTATPTGTPTGTNTSTPTGTPTGTNTSTPTPSSTTTAVSGARDRLGLEGAIAIGSVKVQGEYIENNWNNISTAIGSKAIGSDVSTDGYYVSALWLITGEKYADAYKSGKFDRINPKKDFNPEDLSKGMGAWEIGARYSSIDSSDMGLNTSTAYHKANAYTLALKWIPSPYVRVMFNYVDTEGEQVSGTKVDQKAVTVRTQLDF
jgi:hypothetical protein